MSPALPARTPRLLSAPLRCFGTVACKLLRPPVMAESLALEETRWLPPEEHTAPSGSAWLRSQTGSDAHGPRLVDALHGMDRARCRRRARSREDSSALWQALLAGQFGVLESFDREGRRFILAVRYRSRRLGLTPRESAVVRAAARGLANKAIGNELGMAPSTVGVHLLSALRKLGLPNRRALIHWLPGLACQTA